MNILNLCALCTQLNLTLKKPFNKVTIVTLLKRSEMTNKQKCQTAKYFKIFLFFFYFDFLFFIAFLRLFVYFDFNCKARLYDNVKLL